MSRRPDVPERVYEGSGFYQEAAENMEHWK